MKNNKNKIKQETWYAKIVGETDSYHLSIGNILSK